MRTCLLSYAAGEALGAEAAEGDRGLARPGGPVHRMDAHLRGKDFRPRLRMRAPWQGERPRTGTVVAGLAAPK